MSDRPSRDLSITREHGKVIVDFERDINALRALVADLRRQLDERTEECKLAWKIVAWEVYEHGPFVIDEKTLDDTATPTIIFEENISQNTIIRSGKV